MSISIFTSFSSCKCSPSVADGSATLGTGDGFRANSEPVTLSMSAFVCSSGAGVALLALEREGIGEEERGSGFSCGVGDGVGVGRINEAGLTVMSC